MDDTCPQRECDEGRAPGSAIGDLPVATRAANTPGRRYRAWLIGGFKVVIGLGVLSWLLFSGAIDWRAIGGLTTAGWVLPVAGCLCLANFSLMAWRLRVLMMAQGLRLPIVSAFQLTVTATFFSWCIPGGTGGDLVKMYFLGRWNPGKVTEAVTITLWDRAIGLATFLMLALLAAAFAMRLVIGEPVLTGLLATCAAALVVGGVCLGLAWYTDWTQRWPLRNLARFGRVGSTILRMFGVMHAYRRRPGALAGAVLLSMCAQSCLVGTAYLLATVVAESGAQPIMLVLMPMGWVTNALPVSPGGLGVGEAAFEHLFKLVGLSGGASVLLSWRAVAMVMSLPGLWFYFRHREVTPRSGHGTGADAVCTGSPVRSASRTDSMGGVTSVADASEISATCSKPAGLTVERMGASSDT